MGPVKIKNPDLKFLLAFKLQNESVLKPGKKSKNGNCVKQTYYYYNAHA